MPQIMPRYAPKHAFKSFDVSYDAPPRKCDHRNGVGGVPLSSGGGTSSNKRKIHEGKLELSDEGAKASLNAIIDSPLRKRRLSMSGECGTKAIVRTPAGGSSTIEDGQDYNEPNPEDDGAEMFFLPLENKFATPPFHNSSSIDPTSPLDDDLDW